MIMLPSLQGPTHWHAVVIRIFSGGCFASVWLGAMTALLFLASDCSSTSVTFHTTGMEPPLCRDTAKCVKTVSYWGTAWRLDQKEAARREAITAKGIEDFFRTFPYVSVQSISRTIDERDVLLLGGREVLAVALSDIDLIHIFRFDGKLYAITG